MKISEIGEFGFIERFSKRFQALKNTETTGIGDDCAIMPLDETYEQVVTTDLLVEEIHFLKSATKPFALGHKSLAVNLSDIAAMGATPVGSFLSLAIPQNLSVEYLDEFMEGYYQLSKQFKVPLLGGDTTRSPDRLVINVCVIGKAPKGSSRLRSMAQADDVIAVTGFLGDSSAGLRMILENLPIDSASEKLIHWHHQPQPAINEGLWLAAQEGIHAMMDVSDGIASDLKHILDQSHVAATIQLNQLPLSQPLIETARKHQWNVLEQAATGGEDYQLLLTINKAHWDRIQTGFRTKFNKPLYPIGHICPGSAQITWMNHNQKVSLSKTGFNHFKQASE